MSLSRAAAFADGLEGHVKHRDHEQSDPTRGDHAEKDRRANRVAADFRSALCHDQREDTEDEREGSHHHRAKAHLRTEHRGLANVFSLLALILGEFDDQNAILGRHRDQHHEPDLGVQVERQMQDLDAEKRSEHCHRHRSNTGTGIIQLS